MPGTRRDPYFRRWMMLLAEDLDDPRLYRLPLAYRAVFDGLCRLSLARSNPPGRLLHRSTDVPFSTLDIAEALHATEDEVTAALGALRAQELVTWEDGWVLLDFERRSTESERAKVKQGNAERQRRWRDRQKNAGAAAPPPGAVPHNVVSMRKAGDP